MPPPHSADFVLNRQQGVGVSRYVANRKIVVNKRIGQAKKSKGDEKKEARCQ